MHVKLYSLRFFVLLPLTLIPLFFFLRYALDPLAPTPARAPASADQPDLPRTPISFKKAHLDTLRQAPPAPASYPGGDNPKTVWIVSHRRSGTHLTMDVVSQAVGGPLRVVKTNHFSATSEDLSCECLSYLRSHGRLIHPYRDVRDVLVAMYYYRRRFNPKLAQMSLQHYLANQDGWRDRDIEQWVRTTRSWFAEPDILSLNFDEVVTGMPYVYERIAAFLQQPVRNPELDPSTMEQFSGVVSRGAGKGAGGWRSVMNSKVATEILSIAKRYSKKYTRFLDCPKDEKRTSWNMTGAFEVGEGSGLRVPAACPKEFLSQSRYVITSKNGSRIVNNKGTQYLQAVSVNSAAKS